MIKKIVLLFVVLGLVGGGFFYWWQNQADVRELNKDLPEWIRITKDLGGNYHLVYERDGEKIEMIRVAKEEKQYRVINKKYNYEFLLPQDRKGLWRLEYLEKEGDSEMEYVCQLCERGSILFIGLIGGYGDNVIIEAYQPKDDDIRLDDFVYKGNPTWLYKMDVEKTKIDGKDVIKASGEEYDWGRVYKYFFQGKSNFYKLEHVSEEFIRYIIANGQW